MAHPCINCGGDCHCSGDIDDTIISETPQKCEGCGCETDDFLWDEDDQWDDEEDGDTVGFECVGCMIGSFAHPGSCPICDNKLTPYG